MTSYQFFFWVQVGSIDMFSLLPGWRGAKLNDVFDLMAVLFRLRTSRKDMR